MIGENAVHESSVDELLRSATVAPPRQRVSQLLAILAGIIELAVPIAIALGVSQVSSGAALGPAIWMPLVIAIVAAAVSAAARVLVLSRIAATEMTRLRISAADRLMNLAPRELEKIGVEDATSLYSLQVGQLEALLTADRIRRRTALMTMIGCFALLVAFEWRLTLALLLALCAAGLLLALVLRPVKARSAQGLRALTQASADLTEFLRSIRSATVFGLRRRYSLRLESRLDEVAVAEIKVGHAQATVDLIVKTVSFSLLIGLGVLGVSLVSSGAATPAGLAGFLGALTILLAPAASLMDLLQQLQRARGAKDILSTSAWSTSTSAPVDELDGEVKDIVSVAFEDVGIDAGPDVRIGPVGFVAQLGQILAISGPSGSGKTTLLSAVAGFAPCAEGEVLLNGRP